jgi:uncharacterized membrane protein YcaP (DUF421 family)
MGTVVRTIIVYWLLLLVLRVVGRRDSAQLTPFELLILFLFGGIGITGILGDDHSFTNAAAAIATVALMHVLVSWAKQRWSKFGRLIDGTPVVVFDDGHWFEERLQKMRFQREDIAASARMNGLSDMEQVQYAVIERNGRIAIIKKR